MKKICIVVGIVSICAAAWAVELVNRDSVEYKVQIITGSTTYTSIGSSTRQMSVCSECDIDVEGVGRVHASGSQEVIIENGSITVK